MSLIKKSYICKIYYHWDKISWKHVVCKEQLEKYELGQSKSISRKSIYNIMKKCISLIIRIQNKPCICEQVCFLSYSFVHDSKIDEVGELNLLNQ